jgi:hypothetical protein
VLEDANDFILLVGTKKEAEDIINTFRNRLRQKLHEGGKQLMSRINDAMSTNNNIILHLSLSYANCVDVREGEVDRTCSLTSFY